MAKSATTSSSSKAAELKRANAKLQAENDRLKSQLKNDKHAVLSHGWRRLFIILSVAAAVAILVVANILFWAGNTVVNTDKYTQTSQKLLQDPAIQIAIADYTTNKIFETNDVAGTIKNALPPRADFLVDSLVPQLKNATNQSLQKILASDKFQTVWVNANRKAHDRLITSIKNSKTTDGVIDINDVYARLSQNLAGTKLSFLANKSLPQNIGNITVINAQWIPTARAAINALDWLKPVSLLLVLIFSSIAVWLTRNRRKMVILLGAYFSISMFLLLVTLRIIRSNVVSNTAPAYQTASDHATHIVFSSLVTQLTTVMLLGILISVVAWIGGPYKPAVNTRQRINELFAGNIHESIFGKHESKFTAWFGKYKRQLQSFAVAAIAFIMLLVQLSPSLVFWYGVAMVLSYLVIEVIAQPTGKK